MQDFILEHHFFHGICSGTFVELGARDGLSASNSARFERAGWRGLCIEADPSEFAKLRVNRPGCRHHHTLVSNVTRDTNGHYPTAAYIMTSASPFNGIERFLDWPKLRREGIQVRERLELPVVPLGWLLEQNDIMHVDLLSLDVEGAEEAVLRSVDLERVSFSVLLVENGTTAGIIQHLEGHGYSLFSERMQHTHDAVWVNACLMPYLMGSGGARKRQHTRLGNKLGYNAKRNPTTQPS